MFSCDSRQVVTVTSPESPSSPPPTVPAFSNIIKPKLHLYVNIHIY